MPRQPRRRRSSAPALLVERVTACPAPIVSCEHLPGTRPFFYTTEAAIFSARLRLGGSTCELSVTVPELFGFDGGSVPRLSLIQPVRFLIAAQLHDFIYRIFALGEDSPYKLERKRIMLASGGNPRMLADELLHWMARERCGALSDFEAWRIRAAVRMFGAGSFADKASLEWVRSKFAALGRVSDGVVGRLPSGGAQ